LAQRQLAASLADVPGKSVNLDELRIQTQQALAEWHEAFAERLAAAGVNLDAPVSLMVRQGDGAIVVGDHPQKQAIENVLQVEGSLADALRKIETTLELIGTADASPEFARAYEDDPLAAIEQFRQWFESGAGDGVTIRVDRHAAQATNALH
jgi:hypothetical protein